MVGREEVADASQMDYRRPFCPGQREQGPEVVVRGYEHRPFVGGKGEDGLVIRVQQVDVADMDGVVTKFA